MANLWRGEDFCWVLKAGSQSRARGNKRTCFFIAMTLAFDNSAHAPTRRFPFSPPLIRFLILGLHHVYLVSRKHTTHNHVHVQKNYSIAS